MNMVCKYIETTFNIKFGMGIARGRKINIQGWMIGLRLNAMDYSTRTLYAVHILF